MNSNQFASYQNASYTLQKTRQIVLLYEAAIRFTKQAKLAIEEEDFNKRFELLQKVSNILSGLNSSLDYENGGEISVVLGSFYSGLDMRVIAVNRTNSIEECDYIIQELQNMRESWEKIDRELVDAPQQSLEEQVSPQAMQPNPYANAAMAKEGADFSA